MEELQPGTRIAEKYQLIRPIGRGGMGSVWEAVNDAVGKRVAIKLLEPALAEQPEFMRRFELEAKAAAMIDHPDIVDVLDTGTTEGGAPYMVMEYLQGVTLRQLHKRFPVLTPEQAVAVVAPVLDALAAAHDAGIVHRDLKPANLFLAVKPRPSVKVLDFGISKFQQSDGMTKTGTTMGTPAYMAPEQIRDSRTAGPTSDLYAVGAVLYALLSGRPPFEGDSDLAMVARVLTEEPGSLRDVQPDLPDELCDLVDACLAKDPRARPQTAAEVRDRLLALVTPDDAWVFSRVRELTPTESKGGLRAAGADSQSGKSRSKATPSSASQKSAARAAAPVGETKAALEPASGRWIVPTLVGVVLLLAVVAVALLLKFRAPDAPPAVPVVVAEPTAPTPPTAAPGPVELTLKAEPREAAWRVGDERECNPCTLTREAGTRLAARVAADGYSDTELTLEFDAPRVVTVVLQRAPDPGKRPTATTSTPKPKKPKSLELDETNPYR